MFDEFQKRLRKEEGAASYAPETSAYKDHRMKKVRQSSGRMGSRGGKKISRNERVDIKKKTKTSNLRESLMFGALRPMGDRTL